MAKNKYKLDETMADVISNIEDAIKQPIPELQVQEEATIDALHSSSSILDKEVIPSVQQQDPPTEAAMVAEVITIAHTPAVGEVEKPSPAIIEKKKSKQKKAVKESSEPTDEGKSNLRNVELDDETLWRLDTVKNKLNRSRSAGDPLVTQKSIIKTALQEWLDKNYPDTKKAYQIINEL